MSGPAAEPRVTDTGIGIPADTLEAIFDPFVQVGRALNTPGEGTGRGLAISRYLARDGGRPPRGEREDTFILTLPRVSMERDGRPVPSGLESHADDA